MYVRKETLNTNNMFDVCRRGDAEPIVFDACKWGDTDSVCLKGNVKPNVLDLCE